MHQNRFQLTTVRKFRQVICHKRHVRREDVQNLSDMIRNIYSSLVTVLPPVTPTVPDCDQNIRLDPLHPSGKNILLLDFCKSRCQHVFETEQLIQCANVVKSIINHNSQQWSSRETVPKYNKLLQENPLLIVNEENQSQLCCF